MKPRTKIQVECFNLAQKLDLLSTNQKNYIEEKIVSHLAFATKKKVHCLSCGHSSNISIGKRKIIKCENCNRKLTVKHTLKRKLEGVYYVAFAQIVNDFQVLRYFKVDVVYSVGNERKISIYEVLSHWIRDFKNRVVIARFHNQSYWNWSDSWYGMLEVRNKDDVRKYDIIHDATLPESVFKPEFVKYGINYRLNNVSLLTSLQKIQHSTIFETLLKTKQFHLATAFLKYEGEMMRYWSSIKICLRHGYKIPDIQIWLDYVENLRWFRKDLHSPKYVCPKNLKVEHEKLIAKKRRIEERQEQERKKKRAIFNEESYKKSHSKFFNLEWINKSGIKITVLKSVQEFVDEGDALKHCVFANEYFKKENSLILSAKLGNERLETVEIDLKEMKILQSRGYRNENSNFHDEILQMLKKQVMPALNDFLSQKVSKLVA